MSFWDKRLVAATTMTGKEAPSLVADLSRRRRGKKIADGNGGKRIIIGVIDKHLTKESDGFLLGLVKQSNASLTKIKRRPTLLEQERIAPLRFEPPPAMARRAGTMMRNGGDWLTSSHSDWTIPTRNLPSLGEINPARVP